MNRNKLTHNCNKRLCELKMIIEYFSKKNPNLIDLIKEFHYKITNKNLVFLKTILPNFEYYIYYFSNINIMIATIQNINSLLMQECALPIVLDLPIILNMFINIKPGRHNKKIKSIKIIDTNKFVKKRCKEIGIKFFTKIDIDKAYWKNLSFPDKCNFVNKYNLDISNAYDRATGEKIDTKDYDHHLKYQTEEHSNKLYWQTDGYIHEIVIITIHYTEEYYIYDILLSPTFGFCYYTFYSGYCGYYSLCPNSGPEYNSKDLYSTLVQNYPGTELYKTNNRKYTGYSRTLGESYEKKILEDTKLLNATKV